jgi:putative ABC transport system ATP-binding protein
MALAELIDCQKTYAEGEAAVHALAGVSLEIEQGEGVAIVGASGSGKSTLMHVLGCLDRPTAGHYRLVGHDVAQLDDDALSAIRNRHIGFVFQSFNLIPTLTVLANVEVPLFYAGVPLRERHRRCLCWIEAVGLRQRAHHRPNELSGGERQRAAIARALVSDPLLILADEPTGNLDSATGAEIMRLFVDLNRAGRTIVMVTHDPRVANAWPRQVHMLDGQVVEDRRA